MADCECHTRECGLFELKRAYQTPTTYADCPPPSVACPHVGCRHNTYLDIQRGGVRINAALPPGSPELAPCCALRYAERGPLPYEEIAAILNIHWRGVQAVEEAALAKVKAALRAEGIRSLSDLLSYGFDDGEDCTGEEE